VTTATASELDHALDDARQGLAAVREAMRRRIYGQDNVIDETLMTLLSGGHALLVGVPGVAKTRLVDSLGTVLGLATKRVQFTPDLMPADILGSEVLEETQDGKRAFRFIKGPVFSQLLMADEINRASPRTQSALLQAMQEAEVTVAGQNYPLPRPFHVLATQNPIEQEGTYPLPEAQLDRFILQIDVPYPSLDAERRMVVDTTGVSDAAAVQSFSPERLMSAQKLVRRLPVGDKVVDAILRLVRAARPGDAGNGGTTDPAQKLIAWGPGPRASQAFMLTIRARALLQGRVAPSVEDVAAMAGPILRHRMALSFAARAEGATIDTVIADLTQRLL